MKILFFCPLWGSEDLVFEEFLNKVSAAGYDGVEMSFSLDENERDHRVALIRRYGLKLIAQHWETTDPDFETHKKNYGIRLINLAGTNPLFINSQTGRDYFSEQENAELLRLADDISAQTSIPVMQETHRGKWSFAAHITRTYLEKYPGIRLTLDLSHWCNVAESFLEDQRSALDLAFEHTGHIHARVGYPEGPQISDPRAPEWAEALNIHLRWWDDVIRLKMMKGMEYFTITPEFGAPPYLPLLPFTRKPVAVQWDINVYMMNLLKERYQEFQISH